MQSPKRLYFQRNVSKLYIFCRYVRYWSCLFLDTLISKLHYICLYNNKYLVLLFAVIPSIIPTQIPSGIPFFFEKNLNDSFEGNPRKFLEKILVPILRGV